MPEAWIGSSGWSYPSWRLAFYPAGLAPEDWEADAPFRYLRFREQPYADAELQELAGRIRPLFVEGVEVFAYFRHEDTPTAPGYARRLLELVRTD